MTIQVCQFDSGVRITRRTTYQEFKQAILKVGRFSVFETGEHSWLYNELCRDPEIETSDLGFPWTGVRKREGGI